MRPRLLIPRFLVSTVVGFPATLGAGQTEVVTTVTQRGATAAARTSSSAGPEAKSDGSGGRPQLEHGGAAEDVAAAARAIRRALDTQEQFSSAALKVIAGNRRVIVEGTVATKKLRAAVIHAATKAAPGANLDFMLEVSEE